jgi:hypothetical protein
VNWRIRTGEQSQIGVGSASDIVVGRLEYIAAKGDGCNWRRLLAEAIEYARLLRQWIREHEPRVVVPEYDETREYRGVRPGGKPGPMSDG